MVRTIKQQVSALIAVAALLTTAGAAQAFDLFLSATPPTGSVTSVTDPEEFMLLNDTLRLYVYVDDTYTFKEGGLGFSVQQTNDPVIDFTAAEVYEPTFFGGFVQRWDDGATVVQLATKSVDEMLGFAVSAAGLVAPAAPDPGDPNQDASGTFFAYGHFDILAKDVGTTTIFLDYTSDDVHEGVWMGSDGADVESEVEFGFATIHVVPEPASLGLLGLGGALALLRRR